MFRFIEFSEFSKQANSVFKEEDLQAIQEFYTCLTSAEDSVLITASSNHEQLAYEFQTAWKTEEKRGFKAYSSALSIATQLRLNERRTLFHQQRKQVVKQLTRHNSPYLNALIDRYKPNPELTRKLHRLNLISKDPSLNFESFTTESLVRLEPNIQKIPQLLNQLAKLKKAWVNKFKRSSASIHQLAILYIEKLQINLKQIEEAWCENLLDRIEKASTTYDIYYSDNLFKIITEINELIPLASDKIAFPRIARRDLSKKHFSFIQRIIIKHGKKSQVHRLSNLNWNIARNGFEKNNDPSHLAQVFPLKILKYLIFNLNLLWYVFSQSYRYRYHFVEKYSHLIAQQKLLSEHRITFDHRCAPLSECPEIDKWRQLEKELLAASEQLSSEINQERYHWFICPEKRKLLNEYQNELRASLNILCLKKIEILAQHVEKIKIYTIAPEISDLSASKNFEFYQNEIQKKAMLKLREEIKAALQVMNAEAKYSLEIKFKNLDEILVKFYKLEADRHVITEVKVEITESDLFSKTEFSSLFALEPHQIQFKFENYRINYQNLMKKAWSPSHTIIEKSLYKIIFNYLIFIQEHIDELNQYNEKLKIAEENLIATNPTAASYLREIQNMREKIAEEGVKERILLRLRIMRSALAPEINCGLTSTTATSTRHSPLSADHCSDYSLIPSLG